MKLQSKNLRQKINRYNFYLEDDEIKDEVLKKLKMNGLLLKDAKLVKAMDKDMETYSLIIPAAFKKDGDFSSTSSVVTVSYTHLTLPTIA